MNRVDLYSVITDLSADQVEKQIAALDNASEIVNALVKSAVNAFRRGPDRLFVAERLYRLGSVVVAPLEELLDKSDNPEVKILASLVLLQFGSTSGVPCLLDAIVKDCEYACMAANRLAEMGITEASDRIIARLRLCDPKQVDLVVCLLSALEKLGSELPSDLRNRFATPDVPWQIRTMLDNAKRRMGK